MSPSNPLCTSHVLTNSNSTVFLLREQIPSNSWLVIPSSSVIFLNNGNFIIPSEFSFIYSSIYILPIYQIGTHSDQRNYLKEIPETPLSLYWISDFSDHLPYIILTEILPVVPIAPDLASRKVSTSSEQVKQPQEFPSFN